MFAGLSAEDRAACHCRSERGAQPCGELLLQICCRISSVASEVQFLIAIEVDDEVQCTWDLPTEKLRSSRKSR